MEQVKKIIKNSQIKTPCYLYSVSQVEKNYHELKQAIGTKLIYSIKANSNLDLLVRCAHFLNEGIELASIKELKEFSAGSADKYINNPSADKNFLRAAIASKAKIVIDNIHQLEMVIELKQRRPLQGVILRLNSRVLREANPEHVNIREDHFGMDWEDASKAVEICKQGEIPLLGFHVFKGSYSFEKTAFDTVDAALAIIESMEQKYAEKISFINLGGGFSENWQQSGFDFSAYRQKLKQIPSHIEVAHESGRGLVANCGFFATRVRYTKKIAEKNYVVCDGGMAQNFLLAQTENTFRKYSQPVIISKSDSTVKGASVLVGSSCNKDDVIGKLGENCFIPSPGDICVFKNCGAYNASYTVSPFLSLPEAVSYIIE